MSTDAVCTLVQSAQPDNSTRQINSHKVSVTDVAVNPSGRLAHVAEVDQKREHTHASYAINESMAGHIQF